MAEKKAQHLVPTVYLNEFSQITKRKDKNGNTINSVSIYVNNKDTIEESKRKGLTHNIFVESYFYNIDTIDNDNPIIENNLSKIEKEYKNTLLKLKSKKFDIMDILYISNFTLLQYQRVPKFINNFQSTIDKVANIMVKMSNNGKYQETFNNIAKKMLLDFKIENMYNSNVVFEQSICFVENKTDIPFITSDSPVVHKMLHIDEVKMIFNNNNIEYLQSLPNEKLVFFFFPLSPNFALISTKFILSKNNSILYIESNIETVELLNYLSYDNSFKKIYSSENNKYSHFFQYKQKENLTYSNMGFWAHLYTKRNRYILKLCSYNQNLWDIDLTLKEDTAISEIIADNEIISITLYENEIERGGMRELYVDRYIENKRLLILKSKVLLKINNFKKK